MAGDDREQTTGGGEVRALNAALRLRRWMLDVERWTFLSAFSIHPSARVEDDLISTTGGEKR